MKVSVIGCGNVGVAIAADLAICGHDVSIVKTTNTNESVYEKICSNGNRILLKEDGKYTKAVVSEMTRDLSRIASADIVFVTIQSTYHEGLIKKMARYLNDDQIVVIVCSYMSSFFVKKHCSASPVVVETIGPFLEGRIELEDTDGEIVFRVGCRLNRSPLSIFPRHKATEVMPILKSLDSSFSNEYSVVESALLNPNLVLHTVGAIMSIPRIEYSKGNFCMYREAYARGNDATLKIMLRLDDEKRAVLEKLGYAPTDIFEAGGFLGNKIESFYKYSESSDRAISPTSVRSRYITEDVSQGLVLMESIAKEIGVPVPVTSSLINIADAALGCNFRENGRTISGLCVDIQSLKAA